MLSNLPLGPYRLEVKLSGFRSYSRTGIVLQVNAQPVIDVAMALGDLNETVSVVGAAPLVETRSPTLGQVIENERILELPLNGRNSADLVQIAGPVVSQGVSSSRSMQGGVAYSVAGGQSFGVAYLLDGATHNNPYDNLNLPLPFPDALQEFRVETSALSPQAGMHSGASVNAVTKSGTNTFHGSLFEFLRDRRFNATSPFAAKDASGKKLDDGLNRNQFGGTLGGPLKHDRIFFFGAYQGTRTRQVPVDNINFVPTAAMLAGDFTSLASPACNGGRTVALRAPFVNNTVARSALSPAALAIASKLPVSTDPCGRVVYGLARDADELQGVGKVDVQLSKNQSIFGRYIATTYVSDPPFMKSREHFDDDARRARQPGAVLHRRPHDDSRQRYGELDAVRVQSDVRAPDECGYLQRPRRRHQHLQLYAEVCADHRQPGLLDRRRHRERGDFRYRYVPVQRRPHTGSRESPVWRRREPGKMDVLQLRERAVARPVHIRRFGDWYSARRLLDRQSEPVPSSGAEHPRYEAVVRRGVRRRYVAHGAARHVELRRPLGAVPAAINRQRGRVHVQHGQLPERRQKREIRECAGRTRATRATQGSWASRGSTGRG